MEVVWPAHGPLSVSGVHDGLPPEPAVAYNTVKTTLERLAEKGILSRTKEAKAYLYRPAISREELERRIVTGVLDRLVEEFPGAVASFFVKPEAGLSRTKLDLLREAIERKKGAPDA
jgi:predicted transcriptional regulator